MDNMKYIWNLLKKILFFKDKSEDEEIVVSDENSIKISNVNWNLISNIMENDIVFVKMNEEEIEKNNIEDSHQKRPFIINRKINCGQLVCGYYLTSNINNAFFEKENKKGLKLVLNKDIYNLSKSSVVELDNEVKLPYKNIISIMDHINTADLNKLIKYRNLLCYLPVVSSKENKIIEIGDIVLNDYKKYIIYQVDNTNCYGYLVMESNQNVNVKQNYNYIRFNSKLYFIDYKQNKSFNNNDELCIIERWNYDIVDTIKHNKKLLKCKSKNKKI